MRASLRRVMRILVERSLEPGIPWRVFPQPARRRPLPTNHGHAALPFGVIRAYQSDSSSKPPHRHPRAGALRNTLTSIRGPNAQARKKPLDVGPSISVSRLRNHARACGLGRSRRARATEVAGPRGMPFAAPLRLGPIAARVRDQVEGTGPATPVVRARRFRDTPPTFNTSSETEH